MYEGKTKKKCQHLQVATREAAEEAGATRKRVIHSTHLNEIHPIVISGHSAQDVQLSECK